MMRLRALLVVGLTLQAFVVMNAHAQTLVPVNQVPRSSVIASMYVPHPTISEVTGRYPLKPVDDVSPCLTVLNCYAAPDIHSGRHVRTVLDGAIPQPDKFSWRVPVIGAIAGGVLGIMVVRYTAEPLHIPAGVALGGVVGLMVEANRR